MIRDHRQYCELRKTLLAEKARLASERFELESFGVTKEELDRRYAIPLRQCEILSKELGEYERAILGQFEELTNLEDFGRMLIAMRLAKGMSVSEFAECLQVPDLQVELDESQEYHGLTMVRAQEILDQLKVCVVTKVECLD